MGREFDVVVAGAGPAGWATAAACAGQGLRTALVAPAPDDPWWQTYGAWADDLDGLDLPPPARSWDDVQVTGERVHRLGRRYVLLDNDAVLDRFRSRFLAAGGQVVTGRAVGAGPTPRGLDVVLSDRRVLATRAAVDATGAAAGLLRRPSGGPAPAVQVAHGLVARFDRPPAAPGAAVLMDWSGPDGRERSPSFLYALDLGEGRWLVEETSLAARPPVPVAVLEGRLRDRLRGRGCEPLVVERTERVHIPMGGPFPPPDQRVIGTGAAGGLVHPATGYSVAASLRAAGRLAAALHDALAVRRTLPADVARLGWDAVLPPALRRSRSLYAYGLEALLRLDQAACRTFFDAFFELPEASWQRYWSGTATPGEVAGAMWRLFAALPTPVRARLVGTDPRSVMRAVR